MSSLVTIRDLHVTLGDTPILRGLRADLVRGRITALMGLNGSGKTTFLRALLKEVPYQGQIQFHCAHSAKVALGHIGYVPQKLRLEAQLPLTVADLLALALEHRPIFLGIPRKTQERMTLMLGRVGAPPVLLQRPVERLSGGELQRVLLALALEPTPELLLLDEPAAGVDFKDQEAFYELIMRLNRDNGVTILLVSHDTHVVSRHVDHVWCLRDGRIHCEGHPNEILTPEMLHEVFGKDRTVFTHQH
ncbi:MAG: ATP-binding cassette domain-containing protein [Gemmataceae bacterium]